METFLQYISCYDIVLENGKCRNPYFIGILSAIRTYLENKHCNGVAILILLESFLQSCSIRLTAKISLVAILILLESFLQFEKMKQELNENWSRNPYFIGILSAMFFWFVD